MIFPILQIPKAVQPQKKLVTASSFIPLNLIETKRNRILTIFAVDGECKNFWCFDEFGRVEEIGNYRLMNGEYKVLTENQARDKK
jgi:hypothetical protein